MNKVLNEDSSDNITSDEKEMSSKKKKQDDLEYWKKKYDKMLNEFLKPEKRKSKKDHS